MDLGFAISELKLKFEREYPSKKNVMIEDVNSRGMLHSGGRWVVENKLFYDLMEQYLELFFNSVEGHIAHLTNRSARKAIHESKTELSQYINARFDEFMNTTLNDRGRHDHFQANDGRYLEIKKRIECDVKYPLDELLKNRFDKCKQIIEGRPNPLWNRPWASHALSAIFGVIVGVIVGATPTWFPRIIEFVNSTARYFNDKI